MVLGLRSPFPCWVSVVVHSQLPEAVCISHDGCSLSSKASMNVLFWLLTAILYGQQKKKKKKRKKKKSKQSFNLKDSAAIAEVCYPKLALVMLCHLRYMLLSWLPISLLSTHALQFQVPVLLPQASLLELWDKMSSFGKRICFQWTENGRKSPDRTSLSPAWKEVMFPSFKCLCPYFNVYFDCWTLVGP